MVAGPPVGRRQDAQRQRMCLFVVLTAVDACVPPAGTFAPAASSVAEVAPNRAAAGKEPMPAAPIPPRCPPRQPLEKAAANGAGLPWERLGPLDFMAVADPLMPGLSVQCGPACGGHRRRPRPRT
jgi:hypothetical protein